MKTIFVLLCSFLLLNASTAHPFGESAEVSEDIPNKNPVPVKNPENTEEGRRDITVDATIQSSAHIEVPEAAAEELIKAMFDAFQNTKISGEATIQTEVSVPDEKPVMEERKPQSRSFDNSCLHGSFNCDLRCRSFGYTMGFCNAMQNCVCYG